MDVQPLRVLYLEDEPLDAELLSAHLDQQGIPCDLQRVDCREDFVAGLCHPCDLIIADYSLPTFNGLQALELALQLAPEIPFIFVSGQIGEERAIETLKRGATDYVLKHQLSRLGPAMRRALREADERRQRRQAELERERLEEQLRHAQKLEAVGQLAGGVAHDFNNLLQVILGCADLGLMQLSPDHPTRSVLEQIEAAGRRAVELTRKLLAFSRRSVLRRVPLDLNELLRELTRMLHRLLPAEIALELRLAPGLPLVLGDAAMLETAILNLVINARDALPEGGRITVETALCEPDATLRLLPHESEPGRYVRLAISDDGQGIPEAVRDHIFEPFFTTKEVGKGTGLGLASVYGIVTQHEGLIRVEDQTGPGATFAIYFPARVEEVVIGEDETSEGVREGRECLLLAEDEDEVRALAERLLASGGYTVLAARDGVEALDLFGEHGHRIAGAMLDLSMPRMGGVETARRLRELRPLLPILFASACGAIGPDGSPPAGGELLIKPYTLRELLVAVRQTLDRPVVVPPVPADGLLASDLTPGAPQD